MIIRKQECILDRVDGVLMAFLVFLLEIRLRKLVGEREKMIDQVQTQRAGGGAPGRARVERGSAVVL